MDNDFVEEDIEYQNYDDQVQENGNDNAQGVAKRRVIIRSCIRSIFDVEETKFLLECTSERADTIENIKTDSKSVYAKNSAWDVIEEAFKSNANVKKRSKEQIYDKWRNLKVYQNIFMDLYDPKKS
uniref:Regulatory protein zeste n=1 Tax=Romanomermis culicivorax TaxID=13658 RepID=A0A915IPZ4_ROMCU